MVQRVVGPKGRWSEGSLVRRVVGPKGRWSEGSFVRKYVNRVHVFFFIKKRSVRKWGYRGQNFKKLEGYNAPALRKFLSTRSKIF